MMNNLSRRMSLSPYALQALPVALLIVFQLMFTSYSLWESGGGIAQYYGADAEGVYHTLAMNVSGRLWRMMLFLMVMEAAALLLILRFKVEGVLPVLVPVWLLLTLSCVYMAYVAPALAAKHYATVLLSFAALLLGVALACIAPQLKERNKLLRLVFIITAGAVLALTAYGLFFAPVVNGSRVYIAGVSPAEIYKVAVLSLTALTIVPMQQEKSLGKQLIAVIALMAGSLLILRSLGDAILLLAIVLVIVLETKGKKLFILLAGAGAVVGLVGYKIYAAVKPDSYLVKRFSDVLVAETDPTANANLRRAVLGMLRAGIFGSGVSQDNVRYISYNYASDTDFVYSGLIGLFGIGIGLLVLFAYFTLVHGLSTHPNQMDVLSYTFGNLAAVLVLVQAMTHVGANLNVMPLSGVVLPLLSRSGAALCTTMLAIGLALGGRIQCLSWLWAKAARPLNTLLAHKKEKEGADEV